MEDSSRNEPAASAGDFPLRFPLRKNTRKKYVKAAAPKAMEYSSRFRDVIFGYELGESSQVARWVVHIRASDLKGYLWVSSDRYSFTDLMGNYMLLYESGNVYRVQSEVHAIRNNFR